MLVIQKLFGSSIGKKTVVAVTGLALAGFLIAHMAGNLLIFAGPDAINAYGAGLRKMMAFGDFPLLLWVMRLGLITFFGLHVLFAVQLTAQNKAARPEKYRYNNTIQASFASRTMILSGLLLLFFLIYHLLHYTLGGVHAEFFHGEDHMQRHDVYSMVVRSFSHKTAFLGMQLPLITITYLAAMCVLAAHLYHGIGSLFQTFGWVKKNSYNLLHKASLGVMMLIVLGFMSVPVSILLGIVK